MIAVAAFLFFAGLLLGGALVTAMTRRPSVAAMGLIPATLGVSGLCVLLGLPGGAIGLATLSLLSISGLYLYLSKGLGVTRAAPSVGPRARLGIGVLAAMAGLSQFALALLGVNLVVPGQDVDAAEGNLPAAEVVARGATSFDVALFFCAMFLVFTAVVTGRSLTASSSTRSKGARPGFADLRQGLGVVQRRSD